MEYDGPFSVLSLGMAGILTLQWWIIFAILLFVMSRYFKWATLKVVLLLVGLFVVIFIAALYGIHVCNTTYSCPMDYVPSLIF